MLLQLVLSQTAVAAMGQIGVTGSQATTVMKKNICFMLPNLAVAGGHDHFT